MHPYIRFFFCVQLILLLLYTPLFANSTSYLIDSNLLNALKTHGKQLEYSKIGIFDPCLLSDESIPISLDFLLSSTTNLTFLTDQNPQTKDFDILIVLSIMGSYQLDFFNTLSDPNKDLLFMKSLKNLLKKDGLLFLSIPVGTDQLLETTQKVYGHKGLKLLFKDWRIFGYSGFISQDLDCISSDQLHLPIFILKPKSGL